MKINDLNKIIISGNIFNNAELELFENSKKPVRICNIYGKNGTGKSTISKSIQSKLRNISVTFKDYNNNELIREDEDKIYLYNEDFIDSNVKTSESGIKTIIMLGEQKELDDKIEKLEIEKKRLKDQKDIIDAQKAKYEDAREACSPFYFKSAIEKSLKSNWASRDKEIKGNSKNSIVQYESLLEKILENKDENISKEKINEKYKEVLEIYIKVDSNTSKINERFNKIDILCSKDINDLEILLSKKIDVPEFTEREKMILSKIENGEQKFYEKVKDEFSSSAIKSCPYCFQDITDIKYEIVESINKILNKDVDNHKKELEDEKFKYNIIDEFDNNLKILDEKLILEANTIINKINEQINNYIKPKIDEKINNIYNPIKNFSTNIMDLQNSLNEILEKLENKRIEFNKAIDEIENNKLILQNLNLQLAWYEIKDDYNALQKQDSEYKKLLEEITQNDITLKRISGEIIKTQSDKLNVKIANDKINLFLEYIFLDKNKLKIEYDNMQNVYLIKSHGKDIRPKELSTGERNIIALCYFFTKILENTNEKDEFKEACLIILDDPISSFDMQNKIGICTFFRMIFNKIMKNNNDSRIINLTHSLEVMFSLEKICSDIESSYKLYELKDNKLCRFEYKSRNDYKKMLEDVYSYATIDDISVENQLDDTIGNTMRKLLESYATFNYNKSIEQVTRDEKILNKLEKENQKQYFNNFMYRLILNNESHTFDNTRNIDFYECISREEKVKTAKSVLVLLYILDKIHLQVYFANEKIIENIASWEDEIIPEG